MKARLRAAATRFAQLYRAFAILLTNLLVLLVLGHLVAWGWFASRVVDRGELHMRHLDTAWARAYPGRSREEVATLLDETWSRPAAYQPFSEFREGWYNGRFVNVSEQGFRHVKNQGPWPPARENFNVFVFGGSTAFGYGVADDETIASYLQEELANRTPRPPRTYNFGCAYYYSSLERVRFEQLLVAGFVPDMAVFVDGLNDFHSREDRTPFSTALQAFMDERAAGRDSGLPPWLRLWSPRRLAFELRNLRQPKTPPSIDPVLADRLIDRYLMNKKMIGAVSTACGIQPVFVWQPISVYQYDWKRHHLPNAQPESLPRVGSERMAERLKREPAPPDFIWLAHIQGDVPDPLYVDGIHYAPNLSRAIARLSADEMERRGLLKPSR